MACRRCSQNGGYGWMGGKGHGVETTTTESQAGGNRLMIRDMSHTSIKAATIPLLPARRSFLMFNGDLYFRTLHFGCLPLSIHPTNPALPSINHPHPSVVHHYLSMLTPSYLPQFFWLLLLSLGTFFLLRRYLTITPSRFTHSICLLSATLPPFFITFPNFPRTTRGSCFRLRVEHMGGDH